MPPVASLLAVAVLYLPLPSVFIQEGAEARYHHNREGRDEQETHDDDEQQGT